MNLKSLTFHHTVGHTLYGIFLVLAGVLNFAFELSENMALGTLSVISLLLCLGCLLCVLFVRPEKSDEMSKAHLQAAYAEAYRIERSMILTLMMVGNLSHIMEWGIASKFDKILPFLLGIGEFVIGFKFYKLEKEGE